MDTQPSTLAQHLKTLLKAAIVELPDLYQSAHDAARQLLRSLASDDDPDAVY